MSSRTPSVVRSSRCIRVEADDLPEADVEIAEYPYRGLGGCHCICGLRIWFLPARTIAMVTELPHNPGTSVTNAAEILWRKLVMEYRLFTSPILWQVEHYPAEPGHPIDYCESHNYSHVTFSEGGKAEWTHLSPVMLDLLFEETEVVSR